MLLFALKVPLYPYIEDFVQIMPSGRSQSIFKTKPISEFICYNKTHRRFLMKSLGAHMHMQSECELLSIIFDAVFFFFCFTFCAVLDDRMLNIRD